METEAETEAEPPSNASSALTLFILVGVEEEAPHHQVPNTHAMTRYVGRYPKPGYDHRYIVPALRT